MTISGKDKQECFHLVHIVVVRESSELSALPESRPEDPILISCLFHGVMRGKLPTREKECFLLAPILENIDQGTVAHQSNPLRQHSIRYDLITEVISDCGVYLQRSRKNWKDPVAIFLYKYIENDGDCPWVCAERNSRPPEATIELVAPWLFGILRNRGQRMLEDDGSMWKNNLFLE